MPGQNLKFTDFQAAHDKKKAAPPHVIPVREIPEKRDKQRQYGRCPLGVLVAVCMTIAIILAGVLPALIVTLTRASTSSSAAADNGNTNTGVTSIGNSSATTITSVTASSTLSVTTSGSTVSAGVNNSTVTSSTGFTAGGNVASATTEWYGYEEVFVSCSVDLINITITITVQKTVNATFRGAINTFWSGVLNDTYVDTGSQIIYIWTINPGQTVQSVGGTYKVQAQFYLYGINQTTSADTFQVSAKTVTGLTNTISGTF